MDPRLQKWLGRVGLSMRAGLSCMSPLIPVAMGIFLQLMVPQRSSALTLVPTSDASQDFSHHDLRTGDLQPKT